MKNPAFHIVDTDISRREEKAGFRNPRDLQENPIETFAPLKRNNYGHVYVRSGDLILKDVLYLIVN